jgi:hypothetical protein
MLKDARNNAQLVKPAFNSDPGFSEPIRNVMKIATLGLHDHNVIVIRRGPPWMLDTSQSLPCPVTGDTFLFGHSKPSINANP